MGTSLLERRKLGIPSTGYYCTCSKLLACHLHIFVPCMGAKWGTSFQCALVRFAQQYFLLILQWLRQHLLQFEQRRRRQSKRRGRQGVEWSCSFDFVLFVFSFLISQNIDRNFLRSANPLHRYCYL